MTSEKKSGSLGEATICAWNKEDRQDVCNGDSGGPLYDPENKVLVGLTSFGDPMCMSKRPGVYARISDNFAWIQLQVCLDDESASICSQEAYQPATQAPTRPWCDGGADVTFTLSVDDAPYETSWALTDLYSNQLYTVNNLDGYDENQSHTGRLCVPVDNNECYRIDIDDYYGNGVETPGNDYCVFVNGEEVACNPNFDSHREAVLFPAENCGPRSNCNPSLYTLKVDTGSNPEVLIEILSTTTGNLTLPYAFYKLSPNTSYEYPIHLCSNEYEFKVTNLGSENDETSIFLYDANNCNHLLLSDSDLISDFDQSYKSTTFWTTDTYYDCGKKKKKNSLIPIYVIAVVLVGMMLFVVNRIGRRST
jgi:hypothetical protein